MIPQKTNYDFPYKRGGYLSCPYSYINAVLVSVYVMHRMPRNEFHFGNHNKSKQIDAYNRIMDASLVNSKSNVSM